MDKPVVDASHGQHAHRAARTMHQLDVGRQQILQPEAIDGVGVAAAHFHETVLPLRISQPADLIGGLRDDAGVAEFVDKFHVSFPEAVTLNLLQRGFTLAEHGQHL